MNRVFSMSGAGWSGVPRRAAHAVGRLCTASWRLANAHHLNPWVFVIMSALGWVVHALVYMPWLQDDACQLALLIALRLIALVVPMYVLFCGRRIAAAFSASVVGMFVVNTTWHVCYYVYF